MKSTPGVKLTNLLQAASSYESVSHLLSLLAVWLCNFLAKEYWSKSMMLGKLTTGINFIYILCAAFSAINFLLPKKYQHKLQD